jgi:ATP-binding cassette subfamily B multidrug efflux pump
MTPRGLLTELVRREWKALAAGCVLAAVLAAADVALPRFIGQGLDAAMGGGAGLIHLGILAAACLVVRFVAGWVQTTVLQRAGLRLVADLRSRVAGHLLRLDAPYLESEPVGRLVTRASDDVAAIGESLAGVVVQLLRDVAVMIAVIVLLFTIDLRLALAVTAVLPVVAVVALAFQARSRAAFRAVRAASAEVNATAQERLSAVRTVQACVQEERCDADLAAANARDLEAQLHQVRTFAVFMPLMGFAGMAAGALVLWLGGLRVAEHHLSLGTLVTILAWVELLFGPVRDLAEKGHMLQGAVAAAERVVGILGRPAEGRGGDAVPPRQGVVEFRQVWFAYPGADGVPAADRDDAAWVLRDVSFAIAPGEQIAVVGPTGAGKSTLVGLLLRLHDPQRGAILVDGVDVRAWDRQALRRRLAPVLQDCLLLAGTIGGNLAVAGAPADPRALEAVGAGAILDRLGGLDAPVAARGANLSAGERQLVALARCAAADPAVVVLDEATAALDSATERDVQQATARTLAGRSALIIAHRLATVRHVHRIVVLAAGSVVEHGSHDGLMAAGGTYAEMVRLGGLGHAPSVQSG